MRTTSVLLFSLLCAGVAHAGEALERPIDTRSLGRAGAPLAGVEGGAALSQNPAALARETMPRVELGTTLSSHREIFDSKDPTLYQPCDPMLAPRAQPLVVEQAPPTLLPVLSAAETQPLAIRAMKPVGNYAYAISFSDGHDTGIYTIEYLRELGRQIPNDETRMTNQ